MPSDLMEAVRVPEDQAFAPCLPEVPPIRATGHCRHYGYENTGLAGRMKGNLGGPTCAAGCDNRSEPGAARGCMPDPVAACPCGLRAEFSGDEREAWRAFILRHIARAGVALAAIPTLGEAGHVGCPACGQGTIRWSRARTNGHLWAICSTPNCFSVQQ